jgi:hypothetical protein
MADELVSFSVKSIKLGDIPDDGTMSEVLTQVSNTYKDSASFKEADPTITEVYVEELDDPIDAFAVKGVKTLAYSHPDYSSTTLQAVKGGTIDEDGAWNEPLSIPTIEKSVQLITKSDVIIEIPRGRVVAVFNGDLKAGTPALLDVKITILKPKAPALSSIKVNKYLPPVVSAGNAQNVAVTNAALAGTAHAFRGDVTNMLWTVLTKPAGANPVLATPGALACAVSQLTVNGAYKFQLAVTDSNDYTSVATVTVTVAVP